MKKINLRVKYLIHAHPYAFATGAAVVATAATVLFVNQGRVAEWNEFLTKHDLLDEFYAELSE